MRPEQAFTSLAMENSGGEQASLQSEVTFMILQIIDQLHRTSTIQEFFRLSGVNTSTQESLP